MTEFWQKFAPASDETPVQTRYVARMPDGTGLALPIRDMGDFAVGGLISNQASFDVVDRITGWMADVVTPVRPDIIAGLPTLGHVFASLLARRLGHAAQLTPKVVAQRLHPFSLPVMHQEAECPIRQCFSTWSRAALNR